MNKLSVAFCLLSLSLAVFTLALTKRVVDYRRWHR